MRAVLIMTADALPTSTAGLVDEMIDAGEYGVALETLAEVSLACGMPLSREAFALVVELVDDMRLNPRIVDDLRPLLRG